MQFELLASTVIATHGSRTSNDDGDIALHQEHAEVVEVGTYDRLPPTRLRIRDYPGVRYVNPNQGTTTTYLAADQD